MKRRLFLLGLTTAAALLMTGGAALAASFSEDVVAQLVRLGFSDITAETTLLGRVRIVAHRGDGVREIVLNPRTGEVLRDTWLPFAGGASAPRTVISDVSSTDDVGDDNSDGGGDNSDGGGDNSGPGGGGDDNDDNRNDREDNRDDRQDDRNDDKRDDGNND